LIDMGAQAVDIFGNPESLQVPESLAEPLPNKEELKDKILKLLKNSALTAKDVCEQLGSEMTPQMMGKMLSNMKDVEKKKTGKVVKYSVKQRHELFDMS